MPDADSRRRWLEVGAVVLTGAAFLLYSRLVGTGVSFILPCMILWSGYAVARGRCNPATMQEWGLRLDNFRPACARCFAFAAPVILALLAYRIIKGWQPLPPSFVALLALYPAWALVQQFLVQGLIVANLKHLGLPSLLIVPIAAVLFGCVHIPDWTLAAICVAGGAVWAGLFLWTPNLIPLALAHGWLGTLTYYWVLQRNPLATGL